MRLPGSVGLLLLLGTLRAAHAEPAHSAERLSLRARLTAQQADLDLASGQEERVLRGVDRLGALGTAAAAQRLAEAVEPGGPAASPRARLAAVRHLAGLDRFPAARRALGRAASGHLFAAEKRRLTDVDTLTQQTAALALARRGKTGDLELLSLALSGGDRASEAASRALLAYPPAELAPLFSPRRQPPPALPRLLGALSDQRAFHPLREMVRTGSPEVRGAAALALTALGAFETVALARQWSTLQDGAPLLPFAARILSLGEDPGASAVTARLLSREGARDLGLSLALEAPHPALVPALESLLGAVPTGDPSVATIYTALGRAGGAAAATLLGAALTSPEQGALAAQALGRMSDPEAGVTLERALLSPATRRLAVRAATLRVALGRRVAGLDRATDELSRSRDEADRAAAATARSVLDPGEVRGLLSSGDRTLVLSAGSALLLSGDDALDAAAELLSRSPDPATRSALGVALTVRRVRDRLPSGVLERWLEEGSPLGPLLALALAERDEPAARGRLDVLLQSPDWQIRAGAALGLAELRHADATGRLGRAYLGETSAEVRRAIVRALSYRPEPTRTRTLTLAAELDPDADARALARSALGGGFPGLAARGRGAIFVSVNAGRDRGREAALTLASGSGFFAPAWVAPDGVALLFGLPSGDLDVRAILLAPSESGS